MIAVQVLNQLHHVVLESIYDRLNLLRGGQMLDHLLQGTSAVLVERNVDHLRCGAVDEDGALAVIAMLEELLAKVVAKWIYV